MTAGITVGKSYLKSRIFALVLSLNVLSLTVAPSLLRYAIPYPPQLEIVQFVIVPLLATGVQLVSRPNIIPDLEVDGTQKYGSVVEPAPSMMQ